MYRVHGHRVADLDPLGLTPKEDLFQLNPSRYGIPTSQETFDISGIVHVGKTSDPTISREKAPANVILEHLKKSYCGRVGFEFQHIPNTSERRWFNQLIESYEKKKFSDEEKKHIWKLLAKSEVFDHFMAKRFPQVKRYGLEGAESMMIVLDTLFRDASHAGVRDTIVCMPHRGRLNLLTDLLNYPATALFHKVKGKAEFPDDIPGMGDVLSHLAISTDLNYGAPRKLHVSMLHNPSHLEAANPVALGKARARQMYLYEEGKESDCYLGDRVLCVQMHGDAAFCGQVKDFIEKNERMEFSEILTLCVEQGVVTETLGLSNLPHFTAGGSVHVIVNNQIGYTTPAMNARSSYYTSDVGKMISCPVIHVNADYPEVRPFTVMHGRWCNVDVFVQDVAYATSIAFEYRNKFRKDVIIDLIAYRRMGHNELDEPAFTQPTMYENIRKRKSVPVMYEEKLLAENVIPGKEEIDKLRTEYFAKLDKNLEESYDYKPEADTLKGKWSKMEISKEAVTEIDTGVSAEVLRDVGVKSVAVPKDMTVHTRLQKYHIDARLAKVEQGTKLDWATAEAMAFGTLLLEGYHVRISGQDVGRGTFSQRHAMIVDQKTERTIIPLNRLIPPSSSSSSSSQKQAKLEIANSSLSEFAVLGFEYGVSWETPNRLCIWEAQFGDFFNGAQVVVDTFLSSGESKWLRQSGIVMLLPHGFDGAGPEHSSCRVERFLQVCEFERFLINFGHVMTVGQYLFSFQLCDQRFDVLNGAEKDNPNMHVVNPTTPAQYFHVLRRQMHLNYRKPLIVVAPKGLLRHPLAISDLTDMQPGTTFLTVLDDPSISAETASSVEKVLFVSGKLYYEIVKEREARVNGGDESAGRVAVVRVEELNPFPTRRLREVVGRYEGAGAFVWVQEEPQNQGAWTFVAPRLSQLLPEGKKLTYHGRPPAAAPATGISSRHKVEQERVIKGAFN
ncbi:hypothetical protein HK097_008117 [Rhizophlyctis rosea]|uniref:Transketolase-like pyrimidine-binding domain-containing protein n=1 Tax=Rhizophlyctis rosea TaxID=64517 RepID=A0AAD5X190_9FUNG|nr:hypothetical protein HK097_008117 [Rhizophlyctis rosea]